MLTLVEAVVGSFWAMLAAQEPSLHFSAAQTLALEFIAAATVKMLELAVQVDSTTVDSLCADK